MPPRADEIEGHFRREYGRTVATLVRFLGDIDLAEEAVQEAFAVALDRWPVTGVPPNPGGWITTTARNRAIDQLRREASRHDRHAQAALLQAYHDPPEPMGAVVDDRLRLIFTCCHPALAQGAQVALTLRLDRKSTRLNSSHVEISYAVFCLKKKKKNKKSISKKKKKKKKKNNKEKKK